MNEKPKGQELECNQARIDSRSTNRYRICCVILIKDDHGFILRQKLFKRESYREKELYHNQN